MCWVISTGARSSTPPIWLTMALSACGPPVEEPITSTRGGVAGIGRSAIGCAAAARGAACAAARPAPLQRGAGAQIAPSRSRFARKPELADFFDQVAAESWRNR